MVALSTDPLAFLASHSPACFKKSRSLASTSSWLDSALLDAMESPPSRDRGRNDWGLEAGGWMGEAAMLEMDP